MAISGDYSTPVQVNGFSCRNCTDVDYAKKNIDPAHPKDGPFGVNAPPERAEAVKFGGALARNTEDRGRANAPYSPGQAVSISV